VALCARSDGSKSEQATNNVWSKTLSALATPGAHSPWI
jgi:hypothetical protein